MGFNKSAWDVTPFCSPCGGHNGRFVCYAEGRYDPFVCHADGHEKLSRLAEGRASKGRRGPRPTGTTPDASADNINGSEKERIVTHVHGKSLRPCGPAPPTRRSSCYSQVLIHPPPISAAWDLQSHAMEYQDFQPEKSYFIILAYISPCTCKPFGLADSEIRSSGCAGLQIRRSVSEGREFFVR